MSGGADSAVRYQPIGDYALLADCHSAALVSREGSVDWACLRRFDAGSAFAGLLDADSGGSFVLQARDVVSRQRRYEAGSLVLFTTVETTTGRARLSECFAMRPGGGLEPDHQLLRVVDGLEGTVTCDVTMTPRFDYGSLRPWLRQINGSGSWTVTGGDDALVLHTDAMLTLDRDAVALTGAVDVAAGERVRFSLVSSAAYLIDPDKGSLAEVDDRLEATRTWWADWSGKTEASGPWEDAIRQSAAVLKGLTCAPTGAIVAAPTTSLPEEPGGTRNWDYRYCWVRDATLSLEALRDVGHDEVARGFRNFLLRSAAGRAEDLQIMYGCYGERRLPEQELELEGWRGSAPVRVGNAAATQTQLDLFGHILSAAEHWVGVEGPIDPDEWRFLSEVVDSAARRWTEPDHGMWEMRGDPLHFVHSKVMCWVALDRGIRIVEDHGQDHVDLERWRRTRGQIADEVHERGVHDGHFVQAFGGTAMDASLLRLPLVGFVHAADEVMVATVEAIRDSLGVGPDRALLRRYETDGTDGLPGDEGTFLLSSFSLVEVLALQGQTDEATRVFTRLLDVGNDLGLFAEEVDPHSGELLGNFPQAFTHLGLISAAKRLREAG